MASPLRPDDAAPFRHPADAIDDSPGCDAELRSVGARTEVAEIFIRLFADCMPTSSYKGGRRWRAGYNRMVAIAYVVTPDIFGGLTQEQVAGQLGIDVRVFRRIQREVEGELAQRALTARERRADRAI